jgi:hypothetical protein
MTDSTPQNAEIKDKLAKGKDPGSLRLISLFVNHSQYYARACLFIDGVESFSYEAPSNYLSMFTQ